MFPTTSPLSLCLFACLQHACIASPLCCTFVCRLRMASLTSLASSRSNQAFPPLPSSLLFSSLLFLPNSMHAILQTPLLARMQRALVLLTAVSAPFPSSFSFSSPSSSSSSSSCVPFVLWPSSTPFPPSPLSLSPKSKPKCCSGFARVSLSLSLRPCIVLFFLVMDVNSLH